MNSVSASPANKRRTLYRNLMIALLVAIALLAVASKQFDVELHGLASVLLIASLIVAVLQFQSLDEVAKQAHYVAWLWGSMAVMGAIGLAFAVFYAAPGPIALPVEGPLVQLFGDAEPDTAFLAGFLTAPLLMVVGFAIWWSVYWLRRR
ncbi:MAG: hypothetical protein AB7Q23_03405 [Hyphomonadaceae bacterium]